MLGGAGNAAIQRIIAATPEREFSVHDGAEIKGNVHAFAQRGYRQRLNRDMQNACSRMRALSFLNIVLLVLSMSCLYVFVDTGNEGDSYFVYMIFAIVLLLVSILNACRLWCMRRSVAEIQDLLDGKEVASYVARNPRKKRSFIKWTRRHSHVFRRRVSFLLMLPSLVLIGLFGWNFEFLHPLMFIFICVLILPPLFIASQIWPSEKYVSQRQQKEITDPHDPSCT